MALVAGIGAIVLFSGASYSNYPGGVALKKLHRLDVHGGHVHIGVRAAMTGVSRYGYLHGSDSGRGWLYSKNETLTSPSQYEVFTHLLTDDPSFHKERFHIVEEVASFAGGGMSVLRRLAKLQWPFGSEPTLWIMARTNN